MTSVDKDQNVSTSTVYNISRSFDSWFVNNFSSLPENIGFDEFKSVKNSAGSMSFIFIDNDSKDTIDIVEDRRIHTLREYFSKYPIEVREKVKTITIDIYTPYIVLIEEMFILS